MRKFILGVFLLAGVSASAQITDTAALRVYINTHIVPNGRGTISAQQLNVILNGYLNAWPNSPISSSGLYIPSIDNPTANIVSISADSCMFFRVGNIVSVAGGITIVTSDTNPVAFYIRLPINSNVLYQDVSGIMTCYPIPGNVGSVGADPTTLKGRGIITLGNPDSYYVKFQFTYIIR